MTGSANAWAAATGRAPNPTQDRQSPLPRVSRVEMPYPNGLVFDLETAEDVRDWKAAWLAGVSVAVVYDIATGEWDIYRGAPARLAELRQRLNAAYRVVTFNGERFDFGVLKGLGFPVAPALSVDLRLLVEEQMGRFVKGSLDDLADINLGARKLGNAADAPRLHQSGAWDLLTLYCMNDVALTHRLWQRCRSGQCLRLPGGATVTIPVERL